jgi:hypothetical protein
MISHEQWMRRAQSIELTTRAQLRERLAHADALCESLHDETALEFEYFLRRELHKQLFAEQPSPQVKRFIMRFATARVRRQQTPARVSIRELLTSIVRRSERRNARMLRAPLSNSVLNMHSDGMITRRIQI